MSKISPFLPTGIADNYSPQLFSICRGLLLAFSDSGAYLASGEDNILARTCRNSGQNFLAIRNVLNQFKDLGFIEVIEPGKLKLTKVEATFLAKSFDDHYPVPNPQACQWQAQVRLNDELRQLLNTVVTTPMEIPTITPLRGILTPLLSTVANKTLRRARSS